MSFSPISAWLEEAAVAYYWSVIWKRIMTERTLSLTDRYRNGEFNSVSFQAVWGQPPEALKVLRGSRCLRETELDEGTIGAG